MAMALEDRLHRSLTLYMSAPPWLRRLAGTAYRHLPTALRHGGAYARFARDAAAHLQAAPWHLVEERLAATLQSACAVPAYQRWLHVLQATDRPALERLRALPCVDKPALQRAGDAQLRGGAVGRDALPMFTGGSTAHPMAFHLQRGITRPKETAYIHAIERRLLGAVGGEWTLSLRGRSVDSAARQGSLWTVEPIKRHLIFSSDHLLPAHLESYVSALARLRPRQIHAFPSALHPLATWLSEHPCSAFTDGVRGILLTSESILPGQLSLLARVFPRARVLPHYGHSERVLMAVAGADGTQYRVMPLYGLPELLDAQGRAVVEPGVLGEIVGTSFDNAVMPFLRYRTGDLGVWERVPEPGGSWAPVLRRIEGRVQEFVVCRDQRLISITTLGAAHFEDLQTVDTIQFEQHQAGRVDLKLVSRTALSAEQRARIAQAVHHKTQGGCDVQVHQVERIERTARGKHRMLIQHLDLDGVFGASRAEAA